MKFTIETKVLDGMLSAARGVIATKSTWDVMKSVRIEAFAGKIELRATDAAKELTIIGKADVADQGSVLIEHGPLADWVKTLHAGSQVLIETDGDCIVSKSGRSRHRLPCMPLDTFPSFPPAEDSVRFILPGTQLLRMFKMTVGSASTDETTYMLCGVYLHRRDGFLRCCATNKNVIAISGTPEPEAIEDLEGTILPTASVRALMPLLEASGDLNIEIGTNLAVFETEQWKIATKLIDAEFPNTSHLENPTTQHLILADAEEFTASIRRVAIASELTEKKIRRIRLETDSEPGGPSLLTISADAKGANESVDQVDIELQGAPVRISFNSIHLRDVLGAFNFGRIEMHLSVGMKSMILRSPDAPSCDRAIIAPLRDSHSSPQSDAGEDA